jgi:hypothetical protein
MRRFLIILIFSLIWIDCYPQFYPFDSIPGNLKKGSDAVVRTEQCLFTVLKPGNAIQKIKKAVTLLNDDATRYRYLAVPYDKYSKVNYIRGAVYDEQGKNIKMLAGQDIFDISAITGGSFYSDDRMKVMYFPLYKYPYTIEYEYEISYSSLMGYPDWSFQDSKSVSVEKSGIQFILPKEMKLRYSQAFLKNRVDTVILKDKKVFTWQESNIPAWGSMTPLARAALITPVLYTAPLEFEYGGLKGSMRSWKDFGDWVYTVNKDRDKLPENELNTIKSITLKYPDLKERVKAIYEFVQSKTRYVSIQIGIGGFQTAEASSVAKNGFGDCKALVNYTMALLKEAGLASYYSLVNAGVGARDINTSFVDNQFNHVILCVPVQKDTVWLECTNQASPFNYLGSFTSDRHVLLLTPDGGKIVKTPGCTKEQNLVKRTGSVFINIFGTSSLKLSIYYGGYYFSGASGSFSLQSEAQMKKDLYASLGYPDFTVTNATYKEDKSENPSGVFQFNVSVNGFGIKQGEKIYFAPALSKNELFPRDSVSLMVMNSDIAMDSITYYLPLGYKVESMPKDTSMKNEFGAYSYSLKTSVDKVIFVRRLEFNKGIIPANKYNFFRSFYNSVSKSDRGIIILNKQGSI